MKESGIFPIEDYFFKNGFLYVILTDLTEDKQQISLINLKRSYLGFSSMRDIILKDIIKEAI